MAANPAGQLLQLVDDRIEKLMSRTDPVMATVMVESPLTVMLDTGQVIENPFVFGGAAPDVGGRVAALWLQGGHDVALVVGGGGSAPDIPLQSLSGLVLTGAATIPWASRDGLTMAGRTFRVMARQRPWGGSLQIDVVWNDGGDIWTGLYLNSLEYERTHVAPVWLPPIDPGERLWFVVTSSTGPTALAADVTIEVG